MTDKKELRPWKWDDVWDSGHDGSPGLLIDEALRWVEDVARPERLIELGPGPGRFAYGLSQSAHAKKLGSKFHYLGIECSLSAVKMFKARDLPQKHYQLLWCDITEIDTPFDSYATYVALDFFSHINKDIETMSRFQPGTRVLFSMPVEDDSFAVRVLPYDALRERYMGLFNFDDVVAPQLVGNHWLLDVKRK